jgi:hypothetical protein
VVKLNSGGNQLAYSTLLGVTGATGVAVDAEGHALLTGGGAYVPTTPGAYQPTVTQPSDGTPVDAFAMKLKADGSGLIYSTYLGGGAPEFGSDVAVDVYGNAYIVGITFSVENYTPPVDAFPIKLFPVTPGAYRAPDLGPNALYAFVAKLDPAGNLIYSSLLGQGGADTYYNPSIAVDPAGNVYVASTGGGAVTGTPGAFQERALDSEYLSRRQHARLLNLPSRPV